LYASLRWKQLTLDLGQKHRANDFIGASEQLGSLSVTGGHLVESGNARSMPGYLLSLDPVALPLISKNFFVYGAFGDYSTTDTRYIQGTLVHRTRLGCRFTPTDRLSFDAVIDHYSLWGGTNPKTGNAQVKPTFGNYLRVLTGRPAGKDGSLNDRANVIGDHGGSEIFRASYKGDGWKLVAQHDIPYSDGSGMGFQNFPDGVNTLSFSWNDKNRWVSDILYEHQYTMYQSGTIHEEKFDEEGNQIWRGESTVGGDNYFNNGEYRSGWSHHGRMIGDPLILPRGTHAGKWTSANTVMGFENNRLKAHHFGIGGKLFTKHPYKAMLTYSDNYGTYSAPYTGVSQWGKPWGTVEETGLKQLSGAFTGMICFKAAAGLNLLYGVYFDKGEIYTDSFGATLGIRYSIFSRK